MQEKPHDGWRTFQIIWGTQSISVIGSAVAFFATTIWLTQVLYPAREQKAELSLALAAVALAATLPRLVAAPVAGAWADRHDRRLIMLAADLASAAVSLATMGLMAAHLLTLPLLLGLTLVATTASAFHYAAFDTSYATLVPDSRLPRANGMMQTIFALADVVAPAIAAGLIALPALARQGAAPAILGMLGEGAPLAFAIDAATFLVGAGALACVTIPAVRRSDMAAGGPRPSLWADVRSGAAFIWERPAMLWLLGTFTVANLILSPLGVLVPLVVKFNLAEEWGARGMSFEAALAMLNTAIGLGGVAGGIAVSIWGGLRRRRVLGVIGPMVFAGLMMAVFGLGGSLDLAAAAGFLFAFVGPAMNAHSQAIWQSQTPREMQGRVFAVRRLIAQCSTPLGMLAAGTLGGLLNPGTAIGALGLALAAFCTIQLFNPWLRRAEEPQGPGMPAEGRALGSQ